LEIDFCDFAKVIRIATYFKELLEMPISGAVQLTDHGKATKVSVK
jgi:hypothetical protein